MRDSTSKFSNALQLRLQIITRIGIVFDIAALERLR